MKTPLSTLFREEILRALVFAISFFVLVIGGSASMAYAANNGGVFGEVLNLILTGDRNGVAGRTWDTDTTGTVNNAKMLSGMTADSFTKTPIGGIVCNPGKCINMVDANGTPQCEP